MRYTDYMVGEKVRIAFTMEKAREKRLGHRAVGTLEDDAKRDKSNY